LKDGSSQGESSARWAWNGRLRENRSVEGVEPLCYEAAGLGFKTQQRERLDERLSRPEGPSLLPERLRPPRMKGPPRSL
jgi:hypothetical protein